MVYESDSCINEGKDIFCACEVVSLAAGSFELLELESTFFSLKVKKVK